MSKYKDYDLSVEGQQLVDIFSDYDIQTKLQLKKIDDRWDVRYIWKAVKSHGDDQGKEYECEWEGFDTVDEMLFDMVNVFLLTKK